MSAAKAWASAEIDAVIGLYIVMRLLVARGAKFNKRALIRDQQGTDENPGVLFTRSRGSVEMKLMNVTACLLAIGRDDLSMEQHGYKALNSYQQALKLRVIELVDGHTVEGLDAVAVDAAERVA